jgi:hypothetical protein
VTPKPLSAGQRLAAQMIGQGETRTKTAAELGVSRRSVTAWGAREDFRALVQRARDQQLDREPTAAETLRSALLATRPDGHPDWSARVKAAGILTVGQKGATPEKSERPREIQWADTADSGGARSDPRTPFS